MKSQFYSLGCRKRNFGSQARSNIYYDHQANNLNSSPPCLNIGSPEPRFHAFARVIVTNWGKVYLYLFISLNLCGKILLDVLDNMRLAIRLPWKHNVFQTSTIFKTSLFIWRFWLLKFHFDICQWFSICIDPAGIKIC